LESFRVLQNVNVLAVLLLSTGIITLISALLYKVKSFDYMVSAIVSLFFPFLMIYVAKQDFLVKFKTKDWIYAYVTGLLTAIIIGGFVLLANILTLINYFLGLIVLAIVLVIDLAFFLYFPQNAVNKHFFLNNFKRNFFEFKAKAGRAVLLVVLISLSFFLIILAIQIISAMLFVYLPAVAIWLSSMLGWFIIFYATSSLVHAFSLLFAEKK
jgi:hypothetical protein